MKNWHWKLYGTFLASVMTHEVITSFALHSSFRTYYTILIGFNKFYLIFLIFNIISILINCICVLVVFYYAFNIKTVSNIWRILFFARIVFDLLGNNLYLQYIKSSFYQSSPYGLACVAFLIIPIIPSYIAHYRYISKKHNN